ncbi:hypothetical protein [Tenacibaculum agarivorans]|uniref:hypothetical protein n=1 Tax=Tenacibaculum agarivorans TaxID=1908389 RepID=UPI00094B9229|nr:hypothetical protein [Tenacibaculum agarivorans]
MYLHTQEFTQTKGFTDYIMVEFPYNLLFDFYVEGDKISAKVQNEYVQGNEKGPVICSEAGRHLAILGSILLSQKKRTKNYYLATSAKITRQNLTTGNTNILDVKANIITIDKRKGAIEGTIFSNNQIIYQATIEYQILQETIFSKLFNSHYYPTKIVNNISPYKQRRKLKDIRIQRDQITGVYGTISPSECEGHFENYPALPVAIVGNLLGEIGMELFLSKNSRFSKVIVLSADIKAKKLIFHGEYLTFRGKLKSMNETTAQIYCEAVLNENVIATADFEVIGQSEV